MIFVYTTCADKGEAKQIADILISEKLIACANFWECQSACYGVDAPKEANECVLICISNHGLLGEITARIQELHSYELPLITSIHIEINPEYVNWMDSVLQ